MAYSQHTCPSSLTALERHALTALWRTAMPDAGRGALLISQLQVRQRDFSAVDPAHCCGFYVTLAPCSEWVEMSAALQHASVAGTHPALPAGAMFMLFTAPDGGMVLEMACLGEASLPVAQLLADEHGFGPLA